MPWPTAKSFKKHSKKATQKTADVANAVLKKTGDEASAIKIANASRLKAKKKKHKLGAVPPGLKRWNKK